MPYIEETNQKLEEHMQRTKVRDAVLAVLCGIGGGVAVYLLVGTGGTASSGGISPTVSTSEGWPILGALAGVVGAGFAARATFSHVRQRRRRRFWGL